MPQLRLIFARLLHRPSQRLQDILGEVNDVLRRNEEARIYHWLETHGTFPPARRKPDW